MAITYKIVPIPQYVTDAETYLNAISGSWQLVNIYNSQAYLMSGSALGSVIITGSFTLPSGTVSSSAQVVKLIPASTVSSSVQVDFTLTSNSAGVVSSSAQFKTITNPFTGSFTGSFVGALGGGTVAVTTINTSYTASLVDQVILVSASSANQIINLPTAVGSTGKRYWVKNISTAQSFSITPTGTQKIDTAISTSVAILGSVSGSAYAIVSDGANWWQLSQH